MSYTSRVLLAIYAVVIGIYTWGAIISCNWSLPMTSRVATGFNWGVVAASIVLTLSQLVNELLIALGRN